MNDLKRKADELLGDEEKELLDEILTTVKKQTKNSSGENKAVEKSVKKLLAEVKKGTIKTSDALLNIAGILRDQRIDLPKKYKVWVENQIDIPDTVKVSNLKDVKIPKFPDQVETKEPKWLAKYFKPLIEAVTKRPAVQKVEITGADKPSKPLSVRLSNGRKFYEAIMLAASGGGGYKQVIIEDTSPLHDSKINESFSLGFDASDNLIRIDMDLQGTVYRRTITWTGDNPTAISQWSQV